MLRNGQRHEAVTRFQEALELQGTPSVLLHTRSAGVLQQLGQHRQAVLHLDQAIMLGDSADLRTKPAWSHAETGNCPEAKVDAGMALGTEMPDRIAHSHAEAGLVLARCHTEE